MKSLKTLVKIKQRELDKARTHLTRLETQRDQIIAQIGKLTEDLEQEYVLSSQMAEMKGFFGEFAESIKQQQQKLAQKVVKTETQIQGVITEIQVQFSEIKKYEIAIEQQEEAEQLLARQEEQSMMDELGIRAHQYKEQQA